jgi:antitoxin ParD1/3/4
MPPPMEFQPVRISLYPDHEAFIRAKIEAGECEDASEVIAVALDWLQHLERMREASLAELRREIEVGIAQLERGEGREIDFEAIKKEGRERLARERKEVESA